MKRLLAILFLLLPLSLLADFDAYWYFKDGAQIPQTNRLVYVRQISRYTVSETNIITSDRIQRRTDSDGYIVVSNLVAGQFQVTLEGTFATLVITNSFTNGTTGYVNGNLYPFISTNISSGVSAYSQAASDSRFVNITGDTMTGALIATNASNVFNATLTNGGIGGYASWIYFGQGGQLHITNEQGLSIVIDPAQNEIHIRGNLLFNDGLYGTANFLSRANLDQHGVMTSNQWMQGKLLDYGFQSYRYFPMGYDHWVEMGDAMTEAVLSNKLILVSNLNLNAFVPPGTRYMISIQEWTTNTGIVNGHLPIDTGRWPKGLTNAFRLADLYGCDLMLYLEPNPLTSSGKTGMGTNFETVASDIASWFQTWGNASGRGSVGIRFDQPSQAYGDDQRMLNLRRFAELMRRQVTNAPVPFMTAGWALTNPAVLSAAPPGTRFRSDGDWGHYLPTNILGGNWTNIWVWDVLYRFDRAQALGVYGDGVGITSETCGNNLTPIESVRQAIVGGFALLGMTPLFTYIDDPTYTTNREINAIFQVPGIAKPIPGNTNVWLKRGEDGQYYIGLLNRSTNTTATMGFRWADINQFSEKSAKVLRCWSGVSVICAGTYTQAIPAMTLEVLKITPTQGALFNNDTSTSVTISNLQQRYVEYNAMSWIPTVVSGIPGAGLESPTPDFNPNCLVQSTPANQFIIDIPIPGWATNVAGTIGVANSVVCNTTNFVTIAAFPDRSSYSVTTYINIQSNVTRQLAFSLDASVSITDGRTNRNLRISSNNCTNGARFYVGPARLVFTGPPSQ